MKSDISFPTSVRLTLCPPRLQLAKFDRMIWNELEWTNGPLLKVRRGSITREDHLKCERD